MVDLTIKELYEQGSKACQQYSELVTRVRTLSQQMFIGFAVGLGIVFSKSVEDGSRPHLPSVLIAGGVALVMFSCVLWALSQHYSLAFRAIRETLIAFEQAVTIDGSTVKGPWEAHRGVREHYHGIGLLAWHGPFVASVLAGVGSAVSGVNMLFGPSLALIVLVAAIALVLFVLIVATISDRKRV